MKDFLYIQPSQGFERSLDGKCSLTNKINCFSMTEIPYLKQSEYLYVLC